jgi:hypothetical protein
VTSHTSKRLFFHDKSNQILKVQDKIDDVAVWPENFADIPQLKIKTSWQILYNTYTCISDNFSSGKSNSRLNLSVLWGPILVPETMLIARSPSYDIN